MDQEFSNDELQELVAKALEEFTTQPEPSWRALVSFGDTKILSVIDEVFSKWIPRAELTVALGELRDRLYADQDSSAIGALHAAMKRVKSKGTVLLPHWNVTNPDVMFVGLTPPYGEEPGIFVSALKEAGFSSRHCAWSWWMRTAHRDEEIDPWLPYLFGEIRIWKPKLICPLGAAAAAPLIGNIKITEAHGAVHWLGPWAVMPIYSPTYAAKSSKVQALVQDLRSAHDFVFGADNA